MGDENIHDSITTDNILCYIMSKQCCTWTEKNVTQAMTISPNLVKCWLSISISFRFNMCRYLVNKAVCDNVANVTHLQQ